MCDPMTMAAVASTAGGAYYNGKTQANYVNAVNSANKQAYDVSRAAREAERARQDAHEARSGETFQETLATMDRGTADANTADAAANFTDALNSTARPTAGEQGFLLPGQGESSVAVKDWVAREANKAAGDAGRRIAAMAKLSGMGTTAGSRVGNMREAQDKIGVTNNLRRGSLGASQFEQNIPAATVTPGSTMIGDILSGVGMLAGSGALGGGMTMTPMGMKQQASLFDLFTDPAFSGGKFSLGV